MSSLAMVLHACMLWQFSNCQIVCLPWQAMQAAVAQHLQRQIKHLAAAVHESLCAAGVETKAAHVVEQVQSAQSPQAVTSLYVNTAFSELLAMQDCTR